jgi:NAD+ synthase (glutamine-hydrolysing)
VGILRLGLAQINPTVGDLEGNTSKICTFLNHARVLDCDLVLFPELAITGYPPEDLLFKKNFIESNLKALKKVQSRTKNLCAVVGFVNRSASGKLHNAAAVLMNGKKIAMYHKSCLPNYGVFDEKRYFTSGSKPLILKTRFGCIGVSICEDLWPDEMNLIHQLKGVSLKLMVNLAASPYHYQKQNVRNSIFKKRAKQLKCHIANVNMVGGQDELVFDGNSTVYDPSGKPIGGGAHCNEELAICDIVIASKAPAYGGSAASLRLVRRRRRGGKQSHRDFSIVSTNLSLRKTSPLIPSRPQVHKQKNAAEEIYKALTLATRDYVQKNGFKKVIIGLSGGIDSALVALIACDALNPQNVLSVTMPSQFSSKGTLSDARQLSDNLQTRLLEIPIEKLRKAYLALLKPHFNTHKPNETEENLQARIRGNILMALSNKFNYLVLTTGNKSELATGYCTLYGDMAGGFAVIKDVPKTWVYKLCQYRNEMAGYPLIPRSILDRPPTAELKPRQKDTDSLPDYAVLDPILEGYVEHEYSLGQILRKGISRKTATRIIQKVDHNEYKRRQGPIGVKITPKAFGRDRRMPITNRFL